METVNIGKVPVGDGAPCVLMAEIGTFFNQDISLAHDLLNAIATAGVPLFKTEILHDADICLEGSGLNCRFGHAEGAALEDYRKLIERKTVPLDRYAELFARSRELGLPFVASVYDFSGVDFLVEQGGAAIKIARHNINHFPLIRHAARTGLPLIFDAGLVYLHELARAVQVANAEGTGGIIINHHPGASPAPAEAHHLRVIGSYKAIFDMPIGLSCHFRGEEVLYAAIGCGCNLIEKGVADDPDRFEQDVVAAVSLERLPALVAGVAACSAALGRAQPQIKEPRDLSVRKGLIARRAVAAGEVLSLENVAFAWPPVGISVGECDVVLGQSAARALSRSEPISWADVRFQEPSQA